MQESQSSIHQEEQEDDKNSILKTKTIQNNDDDDDNNNNNNDDVNNDNEEDNDESSDESNYQGHFIIVNGFNADRTKVFFIDPSISREQCCMFTDVFDVIRKANGTDEDIIFIKI